MGHEIPGTVVCFYQHVSSVKLEVRGHQPCAGTYMSSCGCGSIEMYIHQLGLGRLINHCIQVIYSTTNTEPQFL